MMTSQESVVSQLRSQAKKGQLAENVAISFELKGGVGDDRLEEAVAITGPGDLRIKVDDKLAKKPQGEISARVESKDTLELCRTFLAGVDSMVPASEARFLPDTLVGSVTFAIGDERETFYFEADEEDSEHRGKPIPAKIKSILSDMGKLESRHLTEATGRTLQ